MAALLAELRTARWKRLAMSGDEALALVALEARADPRTLYDAQGKLLPPHQWPDAIACCVKTVRGDGGVTLTDPHAARRLVLEQTGKLKNPLEGGLESLAKLLAGDFTEGED